MPGRIGWIQDTRVAGRGNATGQVSTAPRVNPETSSFRPPTASRRRSVALLNSRIESDVWLAASLSAGHRLADLVGPLRLHPHALGHLVEPLVQALDAGDDLAELTADLRRPRRRPCGPAR